MYIRNNKNKNILISQAFKKLLCPKFEKVKTCDVVFIASNKRKNSKDTSFLITDNDFRFQHENTKHKFPLSPKLKNVYNIISKNMQKNDIFSCGRWTPSITTTRCAPTAIAVVPSRWTMWSRS